MNNYFWCANDWLTMEDDMGDHLNTHLRIYNGIKEVITSSDSPISKIQYIFYLSQDKIIRGVTLYPPLFFFTSASVNIIFHNPNLLVTRLANMLYFILLIVSVYLIGKNVFGAAYGLLAATLVSLYPSIVGMSRIYTLDFPLTCVSAFGIYCLIKTDYFTKLRESVIFGIVLGLGILIKGQILFFIIGPFLYAIIKSLWRSYGWGTKKVLLLIVNNALISLIIAGAISSIWWLPVFKDLQQGFYEQFIISYTSRIKEAPGYIITSLMDLKIFSRDWLLAYVYFSLNNISPVLFGLFLLGLVVFLRLKSSGKGIIMAWMLVPYVLFTLFSVKKDRFFMPVYPSMVLISISLFYIIKNSKIKKISIFILIGFAFFQMLFFSYYYRAFEVARRPKESSIFYIITPMDNPRLIYDYPGGPKNFYECTCINPHKSNIQSIAADLIKYIRQNRMNRNINVAILGIESVGGHNDFSLMYILKSSDSGVRFYSILEDNRNFPLVERDLFWKPLRLSAYDYVIALINEEKFAKISDRITVARLQSLSSKFRLDYQDDYSLLDSWKVQPDNCRILLFKGRPNVKCPDSF
ncbi:MAG: glycosyltransferase family 39 protein [Candidatus Omnitrophota bacterium]